MRTVRRAVRAAALAAGVVRLGQHLGPRIDRAGRMQRVNYTGQPVSLWEGPAVIAGLAVAPGAARIATLGAGACGLIDDHFGDAHAKGLRGHLRSLAAGEVTTGSLKIAGLAATGLVAALAVDGIRQPVRSLVGAGVVAGSANLLNLFDLRPGRAAKVALLIGVPAALAGSPNAAILDAVVLAVLPGDLSGATMLGDTGANPLGAVLGVTIIESADLPGRFVALAAIVGLTLASEKISFSKVIASNRVLRAIDLWGRS